MYWTSWELKRLPGHRDATPGFAIEPFTEEPVPNGQLTPRWISRVKISAHSEPFPGPAKGLEKTGVVPAALNKKVARQYAARCAVEWLREQGFMPKDPASIELQSLSSRLASLSPAPMAPSPLAALPTAAIPQTRAGDNVAKASEPAPKKRRVEVSEITGRVQQVEYYAIDAGIEKELADRITSLCKTLDIKQPLYKLEEDGTDSFTGYPDWDDADNGKLPAYLGYVEAMPSRDKAMRSMAEALLQGLLAQKEKRRKEWHQTFDGVPEMDGKCPYDA